MASPLPLDAGYLFLVRSNILLLMVVYQCNFGALVGKMSTCPSTPPSRMIIHFVSGTIYYQRLTSFVIHASPFAALKSLLPFIFQYEAH